MHAELLTMQTGTRKTGPKRGWKCAFALFASTENRFPIYPFACREFIRSIIDFELTNGRSRLG
jgi:hypothetical protein